MPPHERALSKHPRARFKSLTTCGEAKHPDYNGLLVGIGEHPCEIVDSLLYIKSLHEVLWAHTGGNYAELFTEGWNTNV